MKKTLLGILILVFALATVQVVSAETVSKSYRISVTIPPLVAAGDPTQTISLKSETKKSAQQKPLIEEIVRNNETIVLNTYVVR